MTNIQTIEQFVNSEEKLKDAKVRLDEANAVLEERRAAAQAARAKSHTISERITAENRLRAAAKREYAQALYDGTDHAAIQKRVEDHRTRLEGLEHARQLADADAEKAETEVAKTFNAFGKCEVQLSAARFNDAVRRYAEVVGVLLPLANEIRALGRGARASFSLAHGLVGGDSNGRRIFNNFGLSPSGEIVVIQ